jgi:hypothetical protein
LNVTIETAPKRRSQIFGMECLIKPGNGTLPAATDRQAGPVVRQPSLNAASLRWFH